MVSKMNVDKSERVQKRATKIIPELSKTYCQRLEAVNVPTLKYRWYCGDMRELFMKNNNRRYTCWIIIPLIVDFMELSENFIKTRTNKYKLVQHRCHYDLIKFDFTKTIITIWNSLSNHNVLAD